MKIWALAGSTAMIALVSGSAVWADVTPEDIWQSWQDVSTSAGQTLTTTSVAREGDTLVVKGLKATNPTAGESAIDELRFRDTGDGAVEITMSETLTGTATTPAVEGTPAATVVTTVKAPGLVGTASGTPEATTYAYSMPSLEIVADTKAEGAPSSKVTMTINQGAASYLLTGPADAKSFDGTFTSASAGLVLDVAESTNTFKGMISAADLSGKMTGSFIGMENSDISKALAAGFALDTGMSYGAVTYDFDITGAEGPAKIVGGSEGGAFQLAMDAARLMMGGSGKNVAFTFSGAQLPFPELKISYAESGFNFLMPISKSDTPQDFAVMTKIVDLAVSEEIWGMIDPTGALPHDPATLVIDTKGKAKLTTDIMDEAAMAALGETPPGELHALDVTEIRAKIAGAELTGNGAFTFDNTDLTTFQGVPAPTGKFDLKLVGGNTLIDKLVAMGLMSDEDAIGARMMISMFANKGEGQDELTSTLEFKDKHFFANGQQLQ